MLAGECMSPQSCLSTMIGMRRSWLSSMQPFMSIGQPRPFIEPFYVEYTYFASIIGFSNDDLLRERIHEMENVLEDGELHFMYD
jgi:hypothetical protein